MRLADGHGLVVARARRAVFEIEGADSEVSRIGECEVQANDRFANRPRGRGTQR